ncbi:hypothetical protein BD769DRAFT_1683587 [Suillus cothurnatus]|nr:hypothetical protein BD769DRAFT_1683587 [Suillus cothurnatus]
MDRRVKQNKKFKVSGKALRRRSPKGVPPAVRRRGDMDRRVKQNRKVKGLREGLEKALPRGRPTGRKTTRRHGQKSKQQKVKVSGKALRRRSPEGVPPVVRRRGDMDRRVKQNKKVQGLREGLEKALPQERPSSQGFKVSGKALRRRSPEGVPPVVRRRGDMDRRVKQNKKFKVSGKALRRRSPKSVPPAVSGKALRRRSPEGVPPVVRRRGDMDRRVKQNKKFKVSGKALRRRSPKGVPPAVSGKALRRRSPEGVPPVVRRRGDMDRRVKQNRKVKGLREDLEKALPRGRPTGRKTTRRHGQKSKTKQKG